MFRLLAGYLLAHTAQSTMTPPTEESNAEPVPVVVVTRAVHDMSLRNRPIEVCGHLIDAQGSREGQVLEANGSFLWVEPLPGQAATGQGLCVLGVIYRRDGHSEAEAKAARLGEQVSSHGPSPTHVLYRCTDIEDCKELARIGPRGRRAR